MQLSQKLTLSPNAIAREISGETVLLDLESGTYFGLNPVAARAWAIMSTGPLTIADICSQLMEEFDVGEGKLQEDVSALAADLAANGLLLSE